MITITEIYKVNNEIVFFIYGLAFFTLGFAIILQTRQTSRLELAYSLRWLAAFGIIHGLYEWGDLFIPIQASYLSEKLIMLLYWLHLVFLAISFVCLLEFGLQQISPLPRSQFMHWQPLAILGLWSAVVFFILPANFSDSHQVRLTGNALARYFILIPGGLASAYGLRVHAMQHIAPLNAPKILQNFQIAGVSLFLYTIVGGTIPPPTPFFPGNFLNTRTFIEITGTPVMVFRSIFAMLITITVVRGMEIFGLEAERRIEELEQQQIINAERERLARDLHDGAIQKVYTAGLLVESAARLAKPDTELDKRLTRAVTVVSDAILDLRRNLAELHEHSQIEYASLSQLLRHIPQNPNYSTIVNILITDELPKEKNVSTRRANHIVAIINEALANTIRHSGARNAQVIAKNDGELIHITIKDDGAGLPPEFKNGYGLRNMNDRARLLGGKIEFKNDHGLVILLEIPWSD
ncbi:MAG: hypothetical protein HY864_17980 [Chloroflexi bacterium]|nr:hypothetical protein [Chloroflexota bacterium]